MGQAQLLQWVVGGRTPEDGKLTFAINVMRRCPEPVTATGIATALFWNAPLLIGFSHTLSRDTPKSALTPRAPVPVH